MDTNLVKLAVDSHRNKATGNYSIEDNMTVLRNAFVEMNNGSTKLDYKAIRDGKCIGLFALLEEILTKTVVEGLPTNSPIFNFVENKTVALGDKVTFYIPDNTLLTVSNISHGTQGIRRQRVEFGKSVTIETQLHTIKIYEEFNLVLAGRIDFNEFIDRVSRSFQNEINNDIITTFLGTVNKVVAPYKATGVFAENTLLNIIDHVEAATGKTAKIFGSRNAVRKLGLTASAEEAKNDVYNLGYQGKFIGTPVFALKNGHKAGTTSFILNDDDIHVIAGDDKFIKFVVEGDSTILPGDPTNNADFTQEYTMIQNWGLGVAMSEEFGVYHMAS